MTGIDLIRLKAGKLAVNACLEKAVDYAEDDATRAFAAVEDARKQLQQMYVALHTEHIQTIRRAT